MTQAEHPLRRWRLTQRLTLAALAERVGVDLSNLARYERGERMPRPAVLARIRDVTQGAVTANDFLPPMTRPPEAAE